MSNNSNVNIFKEASRQKLKFKTAVGEVTTEQLWDLSLPHLDILAVSLDTEHKDSGKKTFLTDAKTPKDPIAKLKFDVVYDVLRTKQGEAEAAMTAKENKEFNDKL